MSTPVTIGMAAIGLAAGLFGGFQLIPDAPEPPDRYLDIGLLEYVTIEGRGHVRQQILSSTGEPIPGDWSASMERIVSGADKVLCSGSGQGNYNGEVSTWSLDDWTGDDACPDIARAGDIFEVSWTYENEYGYIVSIGNRFTLTPQGDLVGM